MTTIINSTARVPAVAVSTALEEGLSTVSLSHGELVLTFADQTAVTLSTRDLSSEILSQALLHVHGDGDGWYAGGRINNSCVCHGMAPKWRMAPDWAKSPHQP